MDAPRAPLRDPAANAPITPHEADPTPANRIPTNPVSNLESMSNRPHTISNRSIPNSNQIKNGVGSSEMSANDETFNNLPLQPGEMAILFPPILPPNPPGRRVPPILRWEVQIRRRPTDPVLPTASERRRIFVESIKPIRFDKSMKGKEYESVHEFEWKSLLG